MAHSSSQELFKSFRFLACCLSMKNFISLHRFSTGLRPRDWLLHDLNVVMSSLTTPFFALAVYFGARPGVIDGYFIFLQFPYIKVNSCLLTNFLADGCVAHSTFV